MSFGFDVLVFRTTQKADEPGHTVPNCSASDHKFPECFPRNGPKGFTRVFLKTRRRIKSGNQIWSRRPLQVKRQMAGGHNGVVAKMAMREKMGSHALEHGPHGMVHM